MKYTIGIDPGCGGALVVLADDEPIEWTAMPTVKLGEKTRVNGAAVASFLDNFRSGHCYIERVGAMPGQGTSSMFTFGHAAGVVEGVVATLGIAYTLVNPQAWKKRAGLIKAEKDESRSRCVQLYPQIADLHKKAKGQAIADAILIARFGE